MLSGINSQSAPPDSDEDNHLSMVAVLKPQRIHRRPLVGRRFVFKDSQHGSSMAPRGFPGEPQRKTSSRKRGGAEAAERTLLALRYFRVSAILRFRDSLASPGIPATVLPNDQPEGRAAHHIGSFSW